VISSIRWIPILIAIIVLTGACRSTKEKPDEVLTSAVTQGPTAQELFLKGNAFLDQRQWDQAILTYDQAIGLDPNRWDIYMNRAIAYSSNANFGLALNSIELALDHGGAERAEVYFNLGNIYQNSGLFLQSVRAYRMAMAIEGKPHFESLLNLGAAYTFLNEHELAEQTLVKAVELRPDDPRPRQSLALLLQVNDKVDEALVAYERIHQMDRTYAPAYFNRGSLLLQLQRLEEGVEALETYLELAPDGPYARRAQTRIKRARHTLDRQP
jgi:tetratricopeptide (TPR) repeat protein